MVTLAVILSAVLNADSYDSRKAVADSQSFHRET